MIRILVVDDQQLVRQGICTLLRLSARVTVVGEASNGEEALSALQRGGIDVMLLDLRMPVRDGVQTLLAMRERGIMTPVLVLTTFDDDEQVLACLEAGARGYLLKDVALEQLVSAIETVHAGGRVHQAVAAHVSAPAITPPPRPATSEALTERELEILRLLAGGYSNKEIARAFNLAEGTVKNHVSAILGKFAVRDRTRAVLKAMEAGLI